MSTESTIYCPNAERKLDPATSFIGLNKITNYSLWLGHESVIVINCSTHYNKIVNTTLGCVLKI